MVPDDAVSAPLSVAVEPWSCAADELVSVADELSVSFVNLFLYCLNWFCVLVLVSVLVALGVRSLIMNHDDAGATRGFIFCLLIVFIEQAHDGKGSDDNP